MWKMRMRAVLLLAVTAVSIGCGRPAGPVTIAVSGKVTLDGTPLDVGLISFIPVNGKGSPAGAKISKGTYSVDVPLGDMRVEIRSPKVIGQRDAYEGAPNSPKLDIVEEVVPARYNAQSDLKMTVDNGNHSKDFKLESPRE